HVTRRRVTRSRASRCRASCARLSRRRLAEGWADRSRRARARPTPDRRPRAPGRQQGGVRVRPARLPHRPRSPGDGPRLHGRSLGGPPGVAHAGVGTPPATLPRRQRADPAPDPARGKREDRTMTETTTESTETTKTQAPLADIGVTGLATMGRNLARNLARNGHVVAVHNRTQARTDALIAEHGSEGTFVPTSSLRELAAVLKRPRTVIVMVQAGAPTDEVLDQLAEVLEPGDIVVDGGNAHFIDTRRRESTLRERGI